MAAAPPVWVAALPSDDDEEVDDVQQQPRRFSVDAAAVAKPDCDIVEDDDVQVVNVIKHEDHRRRQPGAEGAVQYVHGRVNVPWAGQLRMDGGGGEVYRFAATATPVHRHQQVEPSPRKRKVWESHEQKRVRTSNFDIWSGRAVVDKELYHIATELSALGPVPQLMEGGTLAGGSTAHWREQGNLSGGEPELDFRGQVLGRGPTSAPMHRLHLPENRLVQEHYSNVAGPRLREYGILGGGPASQVRQRGSIAGDPVRQLQEHGFLVPEREPGFAPTGCERLVASQGLIHSRYIEQENFDRFPPDPRVQWLLARGPIPTQYDLERTVKGNTMNEWWSSLREGVGTNLSRLHWDIASFCKAYKLTPEQVQVRREALEYIEKTVHELWPSAEVHLFGSTATGLALPWSDIDVVVIPSYQHIVGPKSATIPWLSELGKHLKRHGQCKSLKQIPHAKVPLLKVLFKSGLACDISFDAHHGPRGVPVIRQFMQQYEALQPLCLVLKFFLGQENLNELWKGGLGSFCLIIMAVSHLQKLGVTGTGHDLGVLLLSFFTRYASMHNYRTDVVSTRGEFCASKQARGWVSLKDPELLSVEDPLDPTSDIAKGSYKIKDVRAKFLKAKSLLLTHWDHDNVLAKLLDTTGNPNHRPKVQVEKGQVIKQRTPKKRKKVDTVGSDMEDGQPVQIRRKQKFHGKQGSGLTARRTKKHMNKSKKQSKRPAGGKESRVERILLNFRDSHSNPRTGSKKRGRR